MRKRSDIRNLFHDDTRGVDGADCRFTALSRTFNVNLHLAQTEIVSDLGTILSHHLGSVRGVFLGTSVSHLTGRGPGNNLTVIIGKGNNNVIKRCIYERFSRSLNSDNFFLGCFSIFCHNCMFSLSVMIINYLVAFFLFATVFLRPLRVRALFFVLCPRTGNPKR